MKIEPVNYANGDFALEIIAESKVESGILAAIFSHGSMDRGNGYGRSLAPQEEAYKTGFYLKMKVKETP